MVTINRMIKLIFKVTSLILKIYILMHRKQYLTADY